MKRLAPGVCCLGSSSLAPFAASRTLARPSARNFHRTAPACLPRRRNFFTSNVLLQQDGSEPHHDPTSKPTSTKRRKGPLKNSLHRVAIVAQKGVPPKPSHAPLAPEAVESDGGSSISAVCVAESFDMEVVADLLQNHGFLLDPDGTGFEIHEVVHAKGFNAGDIFVFPSGTIVTWSLPPDVVNTLATRHLLPAAEGPFVESKEVEDLEYVVDHSQDQSSVSGDVVRLGTLRETRDGDRLDTTLAKIAFSSGLARSTKLAVLESSLTRYLESTRHIPDQLSQGLRFPLSRELILQKTGELLNLRSQLNHYNDLTDSLPDLFWDSEVKLETYYDKIGKALDVGIRIKTLNDKMTYAQEVVNMAHEVLNTTEKMASENHSTRLEWIIIILIAVEVCFELRRVYMEYRDDRHGEQADALLAEFRQLRESLERQGREGTGREATR
ncbi:DUF155-domain-containing protein [Thozetella sp. PMI_491]|nr:DUF155-domain-containing protein [Thozetella sp. PMI_491]